MTVASEQIISKAQSQLRALERADSSTLQVFEEVITRDTTLLPGFIYRVDSARSPVLTLKQPGLDEVGKEIVIVKVSNDQGIITVFPVDNEAIQIGTHQYQFTKFICPLPNVWLRAKNTNFYQYRVIFRDYADTQVTTSTTAYQFINDSFVGTFTPFLTGQYLFLLTGAVESDTGYCTGEFRIKIEDGTTTSYIGQSVGSRFTANTSQPAFCIPLTTTLTAGVEYTFTLEWKKISGGTGTLIRLESASNQARTGVALHCLGSDHLDNYRLFRSSPTSNLSVSSSTYVDMNSPQFNSSLTVKEDGYYLFFLHGDEIYGSGVSGHFAKFRLADQDNNYYEQDFNEQGFDNTGEKWNGKYVWTIYLTKGKYTFRPQWKLTSGLDKVYTDNTAGWSFYFVGPFKTSSVIFDDTPSSTRINTTTTYQDLDAQLEGTISLPETRDYLFTLITDLYKLGSSPAGTGGTRLSLDSGKTVGGYADSDLWLISDTQNITRNIVVVDSNLNQGNTTATMQFARISDTGATSVRADTFSRMGSIVTGPLLTQTFKDGPLDSKFEINSSDSIIRMPSITVASGTWLIVAAGSVDSSFPRAPSSIKWGNTSMVQDITTTLGISNTAVGLYSLFVESGGTDNLVVSFGVAVDQLRWVTARQITGLTNNATVTGVANSSTSSTFNNIITSATSDRQLVFMANTYQAFPAFTTPTITYAGDIDLEGQLNFTNDDTVGGTGYSFVSKTGNITGTGGFTGGGATSISYSSVIALFPTT